MGGKPRPKKYQMVLLNCGYVEMGAVAKVFFLHYEGYFDSKEKALSHLAHSLFEVYFSELDYSINGYKAECCKKALKNPEYDYCPKCRSQLRHDYDFDDFEFWIDDLAKKVANDLSDMSQHMNWWPWLSLKEIARFIPYCIEVEDSAGPVLTNMLRTDLFDQQAAQEKSILHKLGADGVDMLKKSHAEWSDGRDFSYKFDR